MVSSADGREVAIEVATVGIEVKEGASLVTRDLVAAREPKSGSVLWAILEPSSEPVRRFLRQSTFPRDSLVVFARKQLVRFTLPPDASELLVVVSGASYPTLQSAQSAIVSGLRSGSKPPAALRWVVVDLLGRFPNDFIRQHDVAFSPGPKLRDARFEDGTWRLTLDGPNGDSAIVRLSNKFELLETH